MIGYLGERYTQSFYAASTFYMQDELIGFARLHALFEALENDEIDGVILPFERTNEANIYDVLELILKHRFHINRDILYKVRLQLYSMNSDIHEIKKVIADEASHIACEEVLKSAIGDYQKIYVDNPIVAMNELAQYGDDTAALSLKETVKKQKVEGEVTNITPYGAFVKIGYNEGLVHISEISHHHVTNVNDYVKVGEKIEAEIIDLKKNRIALSMKKLQKSPWDTFAEEHKVGDEVEGTIVKKMAKGILLEVGKDVVGILNSKDYSWNPHENLAGQVEEGEKLTLQILSIDPKKQRMSLSKKHLDYNPWADVTINKGDEVSGVVEELQSKGALVKIQNVKAFLPISEIQSETPREVSDALSKDDVVKAVVIDVDKKMWKMVISVKQLKEQKEKNEYEKYLTTEEETKAHTLGDLFKEELENYKK
ncbi:MAG: S1 RNA-binding domain-containing protein [Candidatus Izemoplasmataceae bacterium]